MNITLVGSGARDNRMMSGFKGVIPWENLSTYQEFLLQMTNHQTVIVSLETFENPFFSELLKRANAKILIVTKKHIKKNSDVLKICCSLKSAVNYCEKSDLSKIIIFTGSFAWEKIGKVNEVFYMQVDMLVNNGTDRFPSPTDLVFKVVSRAPLRVEKPGTSFIRNRCDASSIVPIEIQHWLPQKKKKVLSS